MDERRTDPLVFPWRYGAGILIFFALCALLRSVDHDESQYVAAAVLTAHGFLPFRDFAYLQTPLQPFLFAPVAWLAGPWVWPALRLVNAMLGAVLVGCVWRAAREAGASARAAVIAAGLFALSDILLFSIATARNDALPAALLAAALVPIVRAQQGRGSAGQAMLIGLLLAAAAAAQRSYALPAAAYGVYTLVDRRHRPLAVLAGAMPMVAFVAWIWAMAPAAFVFGTLRFPALAPAEYYTPESWKMSYLAKAVDALKFFALGPALLALVMVRRRLVRPGVIEWLVLAGLVAALLPFPTWRQYLLPVLPPLFVLLALVWDRAPPGRGLRIFTVVTIFAGLAPTTAAAVQALEGASMPVALREGRAIRAALDSAGVQGGVATLSPQFLGATGRLPDPRFAAGPFYYRTHRLADPATEPRFHVVSADRPADLDRNPPSAVLVGGEAPWTAGDSDTDALLERWAIARGYRTVPINSTRFRVYVRRP